VRRLCATYTVSYANNLCMERNACWEREATSYLAEDENVTTIIMNMQKKTEKKY